eukprot:CAMPEP_0173144032 /NCGR_PEP_ID=MMETSP1105-20130129/7004_1 /TAXON_ID=2985 /ORGANISM="Ochromonas sp., Strain BG-1" /LENGTH=583 /DNA_ID=CAMNT_0014057661 /DNA_START=101 /DNA_END=1852 /DNA_ORIENTATION=-
MATAFISRVERESNNTNTQLSNVGPGAYTAPSAFSSALPSFAPFASTSKRVAPGEDKKSNPVAPGSYNIGEDLTKKTTVTSVFKSSIKRFEGKRSDNDRGPGDYALQSSFDQKKPQFARPASNPIALIPPRAASPPSIPAKAQSHGYEVLNNGHVKPQGPSIPGYSGNPGDTVGPGDYDPKTDVKFRNLPKPVFPKAPDRSALDKVLQKVSGAPGPGYYDVPGDFDLNPTGQQLHDSDFLVHLNASKKRQTSSFESRTTRDAFLKEVDRRKYDPGPGQYELPPAIQAPAKPAQIQNFNTSGPRFQETQQRSLRITVPPGKYNPITSDFDQLKIKILKQKKMASRSDWAQHIAFVSTDKRFKEEQYDNEVPPATTYKPKVGLAETLPRPNVRSGPFGSTEQRFKQKRVEQSLTRDQLLEAELNREIQSLLAKPSTSPEPYNPNAHLQRPTNNMLATIPGPIRPKYSSVFAPSPESRLRPIKSPPGPPPGAYDVHPKWDKATGVVPMAPPIVVKKKKPETQPGPGQYNVSRSLVKQPLNPKNIMLSTSKRDPFASKEAAPGPGRYEVATTMIRPSHNILLSADKY